jgi:tetratricopeptide (TPR) repeat protein
MDRPDELLSCLERLIETDPKNIEYLKEKLRMLQIQENYSDALELLKIILDKNPNDKELWYTRYSVAKNLHDLDEMGIVITEILELEPDNIQMWNDKILLDFGKTKEALDLNMIMVEKFPTQPDLWHTRYEIAQNLQDQDEMINVVNNLLDLEPDQVQTWHDKILQDLDKSKDKIELNGIILKKFPENLELWYVRYSLVKDQQNFEELVNVINNLLDLEPDEQRIMVS